ncbi:MAG TPA: XcyI family restriction endonuclease, partial [Planctomycetaceae bacterium]|nr:XcyI family restriction endonuclease [Planctomycetaceae bacterium]
MSTKITLPAPDLQIEFAARLQEFRETRLLDALQETAGKLAIRELDQQLAEYAAPECLSLLAGRSLRGEVVFPTPLILEARPALLTYYRLLYGYSQKEFFVARTGTTRFKIME